MNHFNRTLYTGWRPCQRLYSDTRASIFIEFAITLPVLLLLVFIGFEFVSLQLARIKVDKSAYLIANAVSQLPVREQRTALGNNFRTISDSQLAALLTESDTLLPQATRENAKVLVSGFTMIEQLNDTLTAPARAVDAPLLLWAKGRAIGASDLAAESTTGVLGSATEWPRSIQLSPIRFSDSNTQQALARYGNFACAENVILVEVFYTYVPAFNFFISTNLLSRQTLSSRAFLRPRQGDIEGLEGSASFATPADSYDATLSRNGFCR